jgi:hypothetical protein
VQERLGERADHGPDVVGDAPVVPVPPDAIALVDLDRRRALVGLDAVDVEEPVDRPAVALPAADAVDRLHEVPAEARAHLGRVALQQAHHGVRPAGLGLVGLDDRLGPEVLGHQELRLARLGARAQAAAGQGRHAQRGDDRHGQDADRSRQP